MAEQEINHHKRPRNSAFDILRLAAMLMVTLLHITGHGLRDVQIEPFSGAYWIPLILNTFSLVAVNCFVLISGHFLSSQNSSPKKLALLWLQVWTYSVMVYVILCLIPGFDVHFRLSTLVECMFPLLSNQYWFFTCYFLLYLIAPALNRLTQSWNETEFRKALAVLFVFSPWFHPSIFGATPSGSIMAMALSGLWFCTCSQLICEDLIFAFLFIPLLFICCLVLCCVHSGQLWHCGIRMLVRCMHY